MSNRIDFDLGKRAVGVIEKVEDRKQGSKETHAQIAWSDGKQFKVVADLDHRDVHFVDGAVLAASAVAQITGQTQVRPQSAFARLKLPIHLLNGVERLRL